MSPAPVSSPCRRICVLDAEKTFCIGCGRTVEAIAAWPRMTEAERRAAMAQLDDARRSSERGQRGAEVDAS